MKTFPPLMCSWESPIDIEGLNDEDKAIIKRVGFEKWLDGSYKTERVLLRERPVTALLRERPVKGE